MLKEKLKYIFDNVNYWLAFAEAKNGALIAFNIALIIGIASLDAEGVQEFFNIAVLVVCCMSTIVLLYSFIPDTGNKSIALWERIFAKNGNGVNPNYLLYTYIASYKNSDTDIKRYLSELAVRYESADSNNNNNNNNNNCDSEEYDLAAEIIYNSKLALKKYICYHVYKRKDVTRRKSKILRV